MKDPQISKDILVWGALRVDLLGKRLTLIDVSKKEVSVILLSLNPCLSSISMLLYILRLLQSFLPSTVWIELSFKFWQTFFSLGREPYSINNFFDKLKFRSIFFSQSGLYFLLTQSQQNSILVKKDYLTKCFQKSVFCLLCNTKSVVIKVTQINCVSMN